MPHTLDIAVIWHMHQPYYKDLSSGDYLLPWVRLHAIKDYYDMPLLLDNFSGIRQTFNLVPSLLIQLEDYARGEGRDLFLDLTEKRAAELTDSDKEFILANFFFANRETMIKPFPRYLELLHKKGAHLPADEKGGALRFFSENDFRDLQFLFNLSWFDPSIRESNPFLASMVKKGRHFEEGEKKQLLAVQQEIIAHIIPNYRRLMEEGKVELTSTPYYHPILPLICDTDIASRSLPHTTLPAPPFQHPEDGEIHVKRAVEYHRGLFGSPPRGMWPSEGSVSDQALAIIAAQGIGWVATDEEILEETTGRGVERDSEGRVKNPDFLYRPYAYNADGKSMALLFRDHTLSDRIGFVYQHWDAVGAAKDFVKRLHHIRTSLGKKNSRGDHLVPVILDGENCWEHYKNDGRDFLMALYGMIESDPRLNMVTVSEHLEKHQPRQHLTSIFPGSWINHNFKIWIGHEEDRTAWDYLKIARDALVTAEKGGAVKKENLAKAWEHIYIAEGSDWCWWYGDENSTENDGEFDLLFRKNLMNVYELIGKKPPAPLLQPIAAAEGEGPHATEAPFALLHPAIDGEVTNYFEWLGAPSLRPASSGGAMQRGGGAGRGIISEVFYGFNITELFFRFDYRSREGSSRPWSFTIDFAGPISLTVKGVVENNKVSLTYSDESCTDEGVTVGAASIVELAVAFRKLHAAAGDEIRFAITIEDDEGGVTRCPARGEALITVPSEDFEHYNWYV